MSINIWSLIIVSVKTPPTGIYRAKQSYAFNRMPCLPGSWHMIECAIFVITGQFCAWCCNYYFCSSRSQSRIMTCYEWPRNHCAMARDWRIRSGCQGSPVRLRLRGAVFPFETSVMSHQFESKSTTCFFHFEIMEGAQNRAWFQSHFSGKCWKASASSQQWEWCDSALLEFNLTSLFCAWAIFQTFWLWSGLTVPS